MQLDTVGGMDGASIDRGTAAAARRHAVQFYEGEEFLHRAVAEHLAGALAEGGQAVAIAARDRHESLLGALEARGIRTSSRISAGELCLLDAEELLSELTDSGGLSWQRLEALVAPILDRGRANASPGTRAYGEMVDILWARGQKDDALALEEMWNRLAGERDLSLLCAYAMGNFSTAGDAEGFQRVCRQHDHVLPTERFSTLEDGARLGEISSLQQRAAALEAEVALRRDAERRLREVLEVQSDLLRREQAARLEADRASRAKQDFLSLVSHELRTPLNAIAGYAELLELGVRGPVNAGQRDYLRRIRASQASLLGLIDEVLAYAVGDTESAAGTALEPVDLEEVLSSAESAALPLIRRRGIAFSRCAAAGPLSVLADRSAVHLILSNLLSNAVKFAPDGGAIRLETRREGEEVLVRVWNSGCGVPAEEREAIFHPFHQVDARLTREHQGAGLGLPISRRAARRMGGDLTVEGREGEGALFTLRLRRA